MQATIWEQRERRQMQAKHLWYNVDIRWSDLKDKLEVLAPTGLTREDIWRHLFLTKQHKNPYEEGCYTGEDVEDVKQKWEAKKHYFEQHKKDGPRPPCIDLDTAIQGFNIDNTAAYQAIELSAHPAKSCSDVRNCCHKIWLDVKLFFCCEISCRNFGKLFLQAPLTKNPQSCMIKAAASTALGSATVAEIH